MENGIQGIDHIGVVVSDMDRTIDFYTKLLGFSLLTRYQPESPYLREMAYLRFPGESQAKLELYSLRESPSGEVSYERKIGMREIALRVPSVEGELERLRKAGAEVITEPNSTEVSGLAKGSQATRRTRAAIKAPDGVIIGFYHWG